MTRIRIKRVYERPEAADGFRVLADRLWPRGIRKENLPYDLWAKEIAPSPMLRSWFHADPVRRWEEFARKYREELGRSAFLRTFTDKIRDRETITLYSSKNTAHNHALVLQDYLEKVLHP